MNRRKAKFGRGTCLVSRHRRRVFGAGLVDRARGLETYKPYEEGCARWSMQGGGQRIKCFSCLKRQQVNGKELWVNTCPTRLTSGARQSN